MLKNKKKQSILNHVHDNVRSFEFGAVTDGDSSPSGGGGGGRPRTRTSCRARAATAVGWPAPGTDHRSGPAKKTTVQVNRIEFRWVFRSQNSRNNSRVSLGIDLETI